MFISDSVQKRLTRGFIRSMFEEGNNLKKKYGEDNVFDFSLGNPILEPPAELIQELKNMIDDPQPGLHGYMSNAGYVETRLAVAKQMSQETGLKFSQDDIMMTCGSAGGLNVILKTILNPGDEVIIFAPYYTEFENYIDNHSGVVKILPTDSNYIPRLDILESSITAKTKAVLINSPNNPTGVVYGEDFMIELADLLKKKQKTFSRPIFLINDEAYRKLLYDNIKFAYVLKYYDNSLSVNSHSKDLSLAGERIGYITINPKCYMHEEMVAGMAFCNRTLGFINAPALMQRAIAKFQHLTISIEDYQKKRDFLYENLSKLGFEIVKPQGAFYIFPKSPIEDDFAFVADLRKFNILTVPGAGFGAPGYFRIAYCVSYDSVVRSMPSFKKAAEKYKLPVH